MRLKDRRILITGAASGIGLATAQMFVREGARVALLDRDEAALQSAASLIGGVECVADLRDETAIDTAVKHAGEQLGGFDGVVNAAGIVARSTVAESDPQIWRRILDVNLTGPYLVCRAAIPWLRREERGTIVNVASG